MLAQTEKTVDLVNPDLNILNFVAPAPIPALDLSVLRDPQSIDVDTTGANAYPTSPPPNGDEVEHSPPPIGQDVAEEVEEELFPSPPAMIEEPEEPQQSPPTDPQEPQE